MSLAMAQEIGWSHTHARKFTNQSFLTVSRFKASTRFNSNQVQLSNEIQNAFKVPYLIFNFFPHAS